jgi:hypothetical protein
MIARSDRIAATPALVGFVPLVEIDLNDGFRAARMSPSGRVESFVNQ